MGDEEEVVALGLGIIVVTQSREVSEVLLTNNLLQPTSPDGLKIFPLSVEARLVWKPLRAFEVSDEAVDLLVGGVHLDLDHGTAGDEEEVVDCSP